ncbi:acetyl-CoA carboxylase [Gregarina niphandrodes]|uniref:biotin carboxylase n=1 Tax=Gregarina niphandrodes TaxID=110365 RepID=A0A023B0N3_GRENI|nr:acetyl-CoA carboxylase [Gregarina niphandrodes]EZG44693.1 acetyl-CoA carboxylase [Gregarina niphandrodes]|eukprot:XP_011134139.1 acetyl-CoA carboxylase [Gregarina niphandrodes]
MQTGSAESTVAPGDSLPGSREPSSKTSFNSLQEFWDYHQVPHRIKRILIANNGNAAAKCTMSLRSWCLKTFSNENELELVGMATPEDEQSNADYISKCDYIAKVPGGSNNYNYANIDRIREIAAEWKCEAVWPGWGHASENEELPRALEEEGVVWVGPRASTMSALGCKIGSTIIAQSIGVPTVPWSGSGVQAECVSGTWCVSEEAKLRACVGSGEALLELVDCGALGGFPLMIKAALGGGGKGIRVVHAREEALAAFRQVTMEVQGSSVFAMQCLTRCRHLEVQVIADRYGHTLACGTRDCTIQRRHQKIIEEGPPTCCDRSVLDALQKCAVDLVAAVRYVNAATVEFLYDAEKNHFYFLEVNARLQVEHVVTEMLIDVNLPAAQLQVAMGLPLAHIADIADFLRRGPPVAPRHCIAARITAEDAEKNFQPTNGTVLELHFTSSPHVWGYFSIGSPPSRVHQYSDSQFGHLFATGRDRESTRKEMLLSLRRLVIRGEISTNVVALQQILESGDFIRGHTHTQWLEQSRVCSHPAGSHVAVPRSTSASAHGPAPAHEPAPAHDPAPASAHVSGPNGTGVGEGVLNFVLYAGVYKAACHFRRDAQAFVGKITQGQVPPTLEDVAVFDLVDKHNVKYRLECCTAGPNTIRVYLNDSWTDVEYNDLSNNRDGDQFTSWYFLVGGVDGRHRRVGYQEDRTQDLLKVTVGHQTCTFTKEKDPSQFRAPYSAKLVRWLVPNGSTVQKSTPLAEIEMMKMYLQLHSESAGIITHALSEGAVFQAGDLLATLQLDDGQVFERPKFFNGKFPNPAP